MHVQLRTNGRRALTSNSFFGRVNIALFFYWRVKIANVHHPVESHVLFLSVEIRMSQTKMEIQNSTLKLLHAQSLLAITSPLAHLNLRKLEYYTIKTLNSTQFPSTRIVLLGKRF